MAKNKRNIDSFNGFTFGASEEEQAALAQSEVALELKETMVTEELQTAQQGGVTSKKRGRPKVNRETKKRISFTIRPSLYEKASEIACNEGKSVSEIISEFLETYIKTHH